MANATFELTDGTVTLDLNGTAGDAYVIPKQRGIRFPRPNEKLILAGAKLRDVQTFSRTLQIPLTIQGTSVDGLNKAIRNLEKMLSVAAGRQVLGDAVATKVSLTYQMGTVAADDITMEVLHGTFDVPDRSLDDTFLSQSSPLIISGTLSLLCEPFGHLANVVYTQRTLNPEDHGNSFNYIDLAGPFNSHLVFNGASGDVTVADAAAIQNQFDGGAEISVRIKADSDGEGAGAIIFGKTQFGLIIQDESAGVAKLRFFYVFSGDDGGWISTDTVVNIGEYYRVGVGYDNGATGNNPTIYVYREATRTLATLIVGDGLTELTAPTGTRTTDVGSDFLIGNNAADSRTFDGKIDDVRWYGTTGNIAGEDMDGELVGDETNLIHYWPMDEGNGSIVDDKDSVNSNDGTITTATWGIDTSIVGDGKAPMRVKVTENGAYASAGNIWLATRSGERREDTLFFDPPDSEVAGTDPSLAGSDFVHTGGATGGLTTNTTGGSSGFTRWTRVDAATKSLATTVVPTVGYTQFDIAGALLPRGLFRVLARCSAEFNLQTGLSADNMLNFGFALGYVFGGTTVIPVAADRVMMVAADSEDSWRWLDLGELSIPPQGLPESAITPPALNIRVHGVWDGTASSEQLLQTDYVEWACDSLFLLPVDESVIMFPDVAAAAPNRAYASAIAESAGAWILTESDVVDSVPGFSGSPLFAGPEVTRLYILKDDTGDPTFVSHDIDIEYEPQIRTL